MYVYVLRSAITPDRFYIGSTEDLERRLSEHNSGLCPSTYDHRPWTIEVSLEFKSRHKASQFEKYLKTGSGRVFSRRHF